MITKRKKIANMTETEEIRLQRMGLSKLGETDRFLDEEDWEEKNTLFEELKKSELLEKKPTTAPFEVVENPGDKDYIPCHLPIPVLKIVGTVINKLSSSNKYKNITAEYTWAMEEAAEWCKEYITFDEIKGKNTYAPLKIASDPETYAVSNYNEYIPVHVINAEEKYKQIYLNKHSAEHKDLKMDDIHITYRILKCNYALQRNQEVEGHYKKVHLLPKGYNSLRKREIIAVNTNLEFKIADLTRFESTGPNKQVALLDSIHTHVIATLRTREVVATGKCNICDPVN